MNRRGRMRWIIGLGLLVLVFWLALPRLLPEQTLTQRPPEFADAPVAGDTPTSHVSFAVELPLADLERHITREIDASFARKSGDRDFQVWRAGPLQLHMQGRSLELTLPLGFKSRAGPDTRGSLVVRTRMTADIGPDWKPRASVRSRFDWVRRPKVKLLFAKVRVSGVVGRAVNRKLRELDADLEQKVESALTLRPRAENWWRSLHHPERLAEDPPVWLAVEPQAFFFEPPSGDGKTLRLRMGVRANLATSIAAEPTPTPITPLPPLARGSDADSGIALYLSALADYQGLAVELRDKLAGRRVTLDRGAITPHDFTLYTSGRDLVVGVEFEGDAPGFLLDTRGMVYFIGKPSFDPGTRILRIEDFRFTRRLNNPLLSASTWVLQESLRQQMQQRLVWNLTERLENGAVKLSERLNQPLSRNMRLAGQVEQLNLTGIECRAEGIHIGLEVRGQLKVTLSGAEPRSG